MVAARLVRDLMRLSFLLERRYAPYSKWLGSAFAKLDSHAEIGTALERDETWGPFLLAPIEVTGVESLADGLATVRVRCKTAPFNQGKVANELRLRLLTAFARRGIRPFA